MEYKDLSPELKAKVDACANAEELAALASAEGIALTDDQLESVSGGNIDWETGGASYILCPHCEGQLYRYTFDETFTCGHCGKEIYLTEDDVWRIIK